jgi:hypothetical protein
MRTFLRAIGMGIGTLLVVFIWGIVIKFAVDIVDDLLDHGIRKCEVHRFRMARYYRALTNPETPTTFPTRVPMSRLAMEDADRLRKAFEQAAKQQGEK